MSVYDALVNLAKALFEDDATEHTVRLTLGRIVSVETMIDRIIKEAQTK